MLDGGLVEWLELRGFYPLLILALVGLGLWLAKGRMARPRSRGKPSALTTPRNLRSRKNRRPH